MSTPDVMIAKVSIHSQIKAVAVPTFGVLVIKVRFNILECTDFDIR